MKKRLLPITVTLSLAVLGCVQTSEARARIPFGEREALTKVADLPDTDEYLIKEGSKMMNTKNQYLDLATFHKEFNIAWILPLWVTQEPKLVGYNEADKTYYELTEQELQTILDENKLDKNKLNKLGFYTRYGGKVVAVLLILFILWGLLPSRKTPVNPQTV